MTVPKLAPCTIEPCSTHHVEGVQGIYAHFVSSSLATFETEVPTSAQMLTRHDDIVRGGFPYLVALSGGQVIGYAYANSYRLRPAYRFTVENSVYVAPAQHGLGIGRRLLTRLVAECTERGYRQMVAVIGDSANSASIALHRAAGFHPVGTLRSVGYKHGNWVDTVLMQRELGGARQDGGSHPS